MAAYYNENNKYAAQFLRNAIAAGLIPSGDVDERSIEDVSADDVAGYIQCHWFAGIGGWPFSLRLAGWPDSRAVWTGSCPCQPFSVAGSQRGFDDPRHLWPVWGRLIEKRRPATVFGEQVASAAHWLRLVRSDLEAMGYAVGAIPMEAASAGADHFRDRYWFVADRDEQYGSEEWEQRSGQLGRPGSAPQDHHFAVADVHQQRGTAGISGSHPRHEGFAGITDDEGSEHRHVVDLARIGWGEGWTEDEFRSRGLSAAVASIDGCQYVECPDGKWRRLPAPGVRWLGNGIPARVAKLHALGNAIDPRPATEFIRAYMSA